MFRFWINDDSDRDGMNENDSEHDRPGHGSNHADDHVNGRCDLLDFTPVWIDASEVFPADTPTRLRNQIRWVLRSTNANVVVSSLHRSEANKFLLAESPDYGPKLDKHILDAEVQCRFGFFFLSDGFNAAVHSGDGNGVFLVEGKSEGPDLRFAGWRKMHDVALARANVQFSSVTNMYWYHSLRGAEQTDNFQIPVTNALSNLLTDNPKDTDVFFTHGFRVKADEAEAWGAEVFKRLWQAGSNARFHMFTWSGDYGWPDSGLYFPQNVYNALKTGDPLKRLVEREQPDPEKRILMTQSLGNMVACEALRQGLYVSKYFMFDAAVASETFDATLQNTNTVTRNKYVPMSWRTYPQRSWASYWYTWFLSDPNDSRRLMGWPGRYTEALTHVGDVYNYYSSGDETFYEKENPPWLLGGLAASPANYSWQKQETRKGSYSIAGTPYGGWGFHSWVVNEGKVLYSPVILPIDMLRVKHFTVEDAEYMVTLGTIPDTPVFNRGYAPMFNRNATQDEVFMALAKCVPAISSPVGGFETYIELIENHDLNDELYKNDWGRPAVDGETPWKHSDMKDMAYYHVFKLYRQIVEKGEF